jgi:hypothetical protein
VWSGGSRLCLIKAYIPGRLLERTGDGSPR